ncbi:hypothetical protein ACJX0J_023862, partial [Zea mays]
AVQLNISLLLLPDWALQILHLMESGHLNFDIHYMIILSLMISHHAFKDYKPSFITQINMFEAEINRLITQITEMRRYDTRYPRACHIVSTRAILLVAYHNNIGQALPPIEDTTLKLATQVRNLVVKNEAIHSSHMP